MRPKPKCSHHFSFVIKLLLGSYPKVTFSWMVSDMEWMKIKERYSQIGSGLLSGAPHSGLLVHQPEWRIQKYLLRLLHPRCWSPDQWTLYAEPPCGAPCRNKQRTLLTGWPTWDSDCFKFHWNIWYQQFTIYENHFPKTHLHTKKGATIREDTEFLAITNIKISWKVISLIPKHFLKLALLSLLFCLKYLFFTEHHNSTR